MTNKKILVATLEGMLLNEKDFILLGDAIENLAFKRIGTQELKKLIVDLRLKTIEEIKNFFLFNLKKKQPTRVLGDSREHPDMALIEELSEKNELLEQLGQRVDNIYNKLKNKVSLD